MRCGPASTSLPILVVDDDSVIRQLLFEALSASGYRCILAANGLEALERLSEQACTLMFSDVRMPAMDGLELLAETTERFPETDVVMMSGVGTIDMAVEAMKNGARDFITKPFTIDVVRETVRRLTATRVERASEGVFDVGDGSVIVGSSPEMLDVLKVIGALRGGKANVFVSGESGSGKELVAKAVHFGGGGGREAFVAVNCASIPGNLAESTFFGHVKGAFTGAQADKVGLFVAADGGTLFLDEVTEIPLEMQAVLLRAVQEQQIMPVGSTKPRAVAVRIVAATNRDLKEALRKGLLREDLYYRLAVVSIVVPPLRDRQGDIELLLEHFLAEYADRYDVPRKRIDRRALACLLKYDWPGNVRELGNFVERAYLIANDRDISLDDLPVEARGVNGTPNRVMTFKEAEKELIAEAMSTAGGQKKMAAELLGISRQRLYRKLKAYGLTGD